MVDKTIFFLPRNESEAKEKLEGIEGKKGVLFGRKEGEGIFLPPFLLPSSFFSSLSFLPFLHWVGRADRKSVV